MKFGILNMWTDKLEKWLDDNAADDGNRFTDFEKLMRGFSVWCLHGATLGFTLVISRLLKSKSPKDTRYCDYIYSRQSILQRITSANISKKISTILKEIEINVHDNEEVCFFIEDYKNKKMASSLLIKD